MEQRDLIKNIYKYISTERYVDNGEREEAKSTNTKYFMDGGERKLTEDGEIDLLDFFFPFESEREREGRGR